jgi:hypothetical protein
VLWLKLTYPCSLKSIRYVIGGSCLDGFQDSKINHEQHWKPSPIPYNVITAAIFAIAIVFNLIENPSLKKDKKSHAHAADPRNPARLATHFLDHINPLPPVRLHYFLPRQKPHLPFARPLRR